MNGLELQLNRWRSLQIQNLKNSREPRKMSKPSRQVKPTKLSRKEPPGDRSHMLVIGERLMRAGSEGNLVRPSPSKKPCATKSEGSNPGLLNQKVVPEMPTILPHHCMTFPKADNPRPREPLELCLPLEAPNVQK
ncbi:hypothetical protein DNTS_027989 [Danionella cerebrum]|uniref:Uncharacterized protein n=1 Tax=Danionella cerebrum TaxID=2873325 RepID=A0A553RBX0_9TELE|nr:hypothetical protein DNTS_027989 [Danionella translucida]